MLILRRSLQQVNCGEPAVKDTVSNFPYNGGLHTYTTVASSDIIFEPTQCLSSFDIISGLSILLTGDQMTIYMLYLELAKPVLKLGTR
jgi:hypothetical protein